MIPTLGQSHPDDYMAARCPNPECKHFMGDHEVELGCTHGWQSANDGRDGCYCPLTLALQHGPPSEHGGRRFS